jgi:anti-anti-sigma factor
MDAPDGQDVSFTVERQGRLHVIAFQGGNLDPDTIAWLHTRIKEMARHVPNLWLVLDLKNLAHTPSRFLGVLVDANDALSQADGQLRVCGLEPAIREVFRIMRLDQLLHVTPTRAEAIQSLSIP